MNYLINLILKSSIYTVYMTGVIIIVGFILGFLRERSIANFQNSFGWKAVAVTAIIGVPIHEASHAVFCIIFMHKITKLVLIQTRDEDGVLGYVNHSYNSKSLYQQIGNFFIGIAPILGGTTAIIVLMHTIIPKMYNKFIAVSMNNLHAIKLNSIDLTGVFTYFVDLIKIIFSIKNFANPYFILFLFLAMCISSHISLSSADIKGASKGLFIIFLIILVFNIFGFSKFVIAESILNYNLMLISFLIVSLIFSSITYLISLLVSLIRI